MAVPNVAKVCEVCNEHVAEYHKHCDICGKAIPQYHNYCSDIACVIEITKRAGGVAYTPNNLPIKCFRHDGLMLECEHGDHPDYLFPIKVEFIGTIEDRDREEFREVSGKKEFTDDDVRLYMGDSQALLYANAIIAVTISETRCYAWKLYDSSSNRILGIPLSPSVLPHWKLSDESLAKIVDYVTKKQAKHDEYLDNSGKNNDEPRICVWCSSRCRSSISKDQLSRCSQDS